MATPARSVQFRDVDSVVKMYENLKIPCFGIKQNGALNFKYTGESMEDGAAQLRAFIDMIMDNESAAIYTLAIYEEPEGRITEKTPADLSFNFRLRDQVMGSSGEMYTGMYGQLIGEVRTLKKKLEEMQKPDQEHRLGLIGEVMEMEAFQPILLAMGTKIADWVMSPGKTGELKRVSGVPTPPEAIDYPPVGSWAENVKVMSSLNRLSRKVEDVPDMLERLANLAEKSPGQFAMYLKILKRM
jgi:hypothetical protein